MGERVLVSGASGLVGFEVLKLLHTSGRAVRTLSRRPGGAAQLRALTTDVRLADAAQDGSLAGVCDGIDTVFSSLGASVGSRWGDRRSFEKIDLHANRQLLAEAVRAKIRRFVYLSVHTQPSYADTRYVRAHETFVADLRASALPWAVVRPTGIFGSLGSELIAMAKRGPLPFIGPGTARTNPIHEADVAEACLEAIRSTDPALSLDVGGPEVLTRRQILEIAFAALGKKPRLIRIPAFLMGTGAAILGILNPRLGEFMSFIVRVSVNDCVAPAHGTRRLGDYFRAMGGSDVRT